MTVQTQDLAEFDVGRIKARFNFSASEVTAHDSKAQAVVGLAVVANETQFVDTQLDTLINFIQREGRFYVGTIERETFSFNP